ncbi:MAG TPA: hypothetical protein VMG12_04235 [Polyangiaceae bacterium]|nr:hypothetical protein [Polyangiaceae bacterium]
MALGFLALPVRAHAPPLGARVLSPAGGGDEVIITNRGLVFRDPASGASRLLCNEALRITTAELPNVALLGDGGLLVASSSGLRLSRDQGCTWSDVGQMETTNTPALAADPNDRNSVVVASYDSDAPGLRLTHDAGATWTTIYTTDDIDFVHSLLVSSVDSATIYATVASYAPGEPPVHSLLRTHDGGTSWQRTTLPLNEKDYLASVAAVSPTDPATLVVYTVANSPGLDPARVLVSHDSGDSFGVALERPEIRGAGYGPDGKLWVAARDGLYGADDDLTAFEQRSVASELGCVLERAGELLVCGHYAGLTAASGIGISADGGGSFDRWLDFENVDAAVACPAESLTSALCAQPWLDWEAEMSGLVPPTAPGAYGPVGTPGATPGAMPGAGGTPSVAPPPVDTAPPASTGGELGADDVGASANCTLHTGSPSRAGSRSRAVALLGLGLFGAGCLRRLMRPRCGRSTPPPARI